MLNSYDIGSVTGGQVDEIALIVPRAFYTRDYRLTHLF
jgi:hypothetical protein